MIILETDRLILRHLTTADAEDFFALNADPEVIRYTGDAAFDNIAHAKQFLENYADYQENGYGRWAVICKDTGQMLGWNGLKFNGQETDIGFRFFKKYWNRGYATESSLGVISYGFDQLNLNRIVGRAMKENLQSVRVLEKAGLSYVGETEFEKHPGVLYQVARPEEIDTSFISHRH